MSLSEKEHSFGADIQQLMHIIIHTFYSNKDVFLRELISNASDALDKVRYESLQNSSLLTGNTELNIQIKYEKGDHKLVITDSGIGMNKEDILQNIGTIASSGTKKFIQALEEKKDMNLIGQFGVGFYSAFLVADRVVVRTKKAGENQQYRWESSGESTFTLEEDNNEEYALVRGTSIELYLREDDIEYGQEQRLKSIISTHSQFISFPIQLWVEKTREVEVENEKTEEATDSDDDKPVIEEVKDGDEKKEEKKTVTETYQEWDTLNNVKPIWLRKSDEVESDEYKSFYKSISSGKEFSTYSHFAVEGHVNVNGLLFVPSRAPDDIFTKGAKQNIKLYVKRVFITDKLDDMLPDYLNFIQGVIDSEDLPLTVSREMLQQNRVITSVKNVIVKQSIKMLEKLAEDENEYISFYREYSKNIKLGVHEDNKNQDKLMNLLRYQTSRTDDLISLDTYIENMKEDQPGIYYITGETLDQVKASPFLQKLKKKDYEVLYMTEAIDEYVVSKVGSFKEKKLLCVTKEGTDLGDDEDDKKQLEHAKGIYKELCEKMTEYLKSKIAKVDVSDRIVDSPCCLVSANYGMTANMERILKAQTLGKQNGMMDFMSKNKVLEINPSHNMIQSLAIRFRNGEDIENTTWLLYESATLDSGFVLDQPSKFVGRIYSYLESQLTSGIDIYDFQQKLKVPEKTEKLESIKEQIETEIQDATKDDSSEQGQNAETVNIDVSETTP
jgi:molecular chaperone HtpG